LRNQVQLITYVDRLSGDLSTLGALLNGSLGGSSATFTYFRFFTPSTEPMLVSTRQITQKSTPAWVIGMT
jgi:hypothetical protein